MSRDTKDSAPDTDASLAIGATRSEHPVPGSVKRGGGTIVDIASIAALVPEILEGMYGLEDVRPRLKPDDNLKSDDKEKPDDKE